MAATPLYGGSNGVTELDVGQKGSDLNGSNFAEFEAHVNHGRPDNPTVASKPVQTNQVIQDVLGFQGQIVTWSGIIRFSTNAKLVVVMNNISLARDGYTRNFTSGVPGTVDETELKYTKLVDAHGNVMTDQARLIDAKWDRVRTLAASTFSLWTTLMLTFRILR